MNTVKDKMMKRDRMNDRDDVECAPAADAAVDVCLVSTGVMPETTLDSGGSSWPEPFEEEVGDE